MNEMMTHMIPAWVCVVGFIVMALLCIECILECGRWRWRWRDANMERQAYQSGLDQLTDEAVKFTNACGLPCRVVIAEQKICGPPQERTIRMDAEHVLSFALLLRDFDRERRKRKAAAGDK